MGLLVSSCQDYSLLCLPFSRSHVIPVFVQSTARMVSGSWSLPGCLFYLICPQAAAVRPSAPDCRPDQASNRPILPHPAPAARGYSLL